MSLTDKVKELLLPILNEHSLKLYDLVYEKEEGENFLRIFIERDDFSMDLDTCVLVSENLSPLLDETNLIEEDYFLEVASSGLDRLLKLEEYKKAIDKYVLVLVNEEVLGFNKLVGYLKQTDESKIKIEINLKGRIKLLEIPLNIIKEIYLTCKY